MIIDYKEPFFYSKLLSKFVNIFFYNGLKERVEKIIYFTFKFLKCKLRIQTPLFYFFECIETLRPLLGLKKKFKFFTGGIKKIQYISYYLISSKSYSLGIH
jgi:ribosomal protein S7